MKRWLMIAAVLGALGNAALAAPAMAASPSLTVKVDDAPKNAVCVVCRVKDGSTHEEPVKAVRIRDGKVYTFCQQACAEAFDADPAAYMPSALPRPAPALSAADLKGVAVQWDQYRGRIVLLDFWATWCAPCRKSMPELQKLHDRYSKDGFSVLGVSIDEGGPAKVKKFLAAKKYSYPIALDSEKTPTWEAYGVKGIPSAYLVDREGNVVAEWRGTVDPAQIESELKKLLSEVD